MECFTIFKVQAGWIGLVGSEKGIQRIYLPGLDRAELRERIRREFPEYAENPSFLEIPEKQIKEYFSGNRTEFDFPLDISKATPFQKRVYKVMSGIPFGEIRTYRWLAQKIGNPKALRAVGNANGKNRWPIVIPCHRIVGSSGGLTGFSAAGGLDLKAFLLKLEGNEVEGKTVVFPKRT